MYVLFVLGPELVQSLTGTSVDLREVLFLWQGVSDEDSKTSPWTQIAKYKLMVEEELAKLEGYEIK